MAKRIVGLILIFGIFVTMFGLIIANSKYIFSSHEFYTQKELNQSYEDGYNRGSYDNRDEILDKAIEKYAFENSELKAQIGSLQSDINSNEEQIELYEKIILNLQLQVNTLESEKQENLNLINELNEQIEILRAQINSLEGDNL